MYKKAICTRHEEILEYSKAGLLEIDRWESKRLDDVQDLIENLKSLLEDIVSEVADAMKDGQAMENGLSHKKELIVDLESDIFKLRKEVLEKETAVAQLQEDLTSLKLELENV
jgi:chromosome segregation ATPase